jgi:Multicopper oxidase
LEAACGSDSASLSQYTTERVTRGEYRLVLDNRSDEAHPIHLHRHTFELTKVEGVATSGVRKDVVAVQPKSRVEVDLVAQQSRADPVPLSSPDAHGLRLHGANEGLFCGNIIAQIWRDIKNSASLEMADRIESAIREKILYLIGKPSGGH